MTVLSLVVFIKEQCRIVSASSLCVADTYKNRVEKGALFVGERLNLRSDEARLTKSCYRGRGDSACKSCEQGKK